MMKKNIHDKVSPAWNALLSAVRKKSTISSSDLTQLVKKHSHVSPDYALRYLQQLGVLQQPEGGPRGIYAVAHEKDKTYLSDPIEIIQTIYGENVLFGYGTALYLHGLSRYARLSEYYVVSSNKRKRRSMKDFTIRFVKTPLLKEIGISTINHGQWPVRVSDLERTIIDCIHRPKYAQGWENVVHALNRVEGPDGRRLIEYVKQYRTPSLVSKVGVLLEHFKDRWKINNSTLDSLRPYLSKTPVKFSRESGGSLNKDWNIFVPKNIFNE